MSFPRRVRQQLSTPKRTAVGQRIPGLHQKATDKFQDDVRAYRKGREENALLDDMERIAAARGQRLDDVGDMNYARIEGQAVGGRALKKAAPIAALSGLGAVGVGYAMNNGQPFAGVGSDPLAQARNSVAQANALLGSERMLEAAALDQIDYMEQQQQATDDVGGNQFNQQVSQLVDARAQELQSVPIQKSDGTVAPMGFDTAIRLAQEEVGLQLRAQGIV